MAARFERLRHLNALRYGVAVERVMIVTDNRIEIAMKFPIEACAA
jgi:hypothetical protein